MPIYWKAVAAISPEEMIGWRVILALPFLAPMLLLTGGAGQVRRVFRSPRLLGALFVSLGGLGFAIRRRMS